MSLSESYATALCVWREARGECADAMRGVYHVILNRMQDRRWPDTAIGVILQPLQFSSFNESDPNSKKYPGLNHPAWLQVCRVIDAPGDDPTKGANHYESIGDAARRPNWADGKRMTATIGAFRFYRL